MIGVECRSHYVAANPMSVMIGCAAMTPDGKVASAAMVALPGKVQGNEEGGAGIVIDEKVHLRMHEQDILVARRVFKRIAEDDLYNVPAHQFAERGHGFISCGASTCQ